MLLNNEFFDLAVFFNNAFGNIIKSQSRCFFTTWQYYYIIGSARKFF